MGTEHGAATESPSAGRPTARSFTREGAIRAMVDAPLPCALAPLACMLPSAVLTTLSQERPETFVAAAWAAQIGGLLGAYVIASVGAAATLSGRRPGAVLRAGLGRLPAAFAVSAIGLAAIAVASLFLFVPGLFVVAVIGPVAPVAVLEGRGAAAALRRAHELTREHLRAIVASYLALAGAWMVSCCGIGACLLFTRPAAAFVTWSAAHATVSLLTFVSQGLVIGAVSSLGGAVYARALEHRGEAAPDEAPASF